MGTRILAKRIFFADKDHPHACGDKNIKNRSNKERIGSSPRVWGQVQALVGTRA